MTISRRDFLKASGLMAAWTALSACAPDTETTPSHNHATQSPTQAGQPLPGPTQVVVPSAMPLPDGEALLQHTLRRLTFGPTPEMFARARSIGLDTFIEEQLSPESIPEPEIDALLQPFRTLNMNVAQRLELNENSRSARELIDATLLRQRHSQRQVFEMMVDFWGNHFNIYIGKFLCKVLKTDDDLKVIRPNALGKFRDLLYASAKSPAMLIYLDQAQSMGDSPNENYARELMELHTVGVESGYSHHDVAELARVLTGWTVSGPNNQKIGPGIYYFNPDIHDYGEKHVLGAMISPTGESEGMMILDMLASHNSTAHFISKKLARRFISDSPDPVFVDALSQVFIDTDGDIRPLLRAILNSDAFKSSAGMKFKTPLDFFISTLRVTDTKITENSRKLYEQLQLLGQVPFSWLMPDGYPDVEEYWATTSGMLDRWNFGFMLVSNVIRGAAVNLPALTKDAASPEDVVDVLSIRFLGDRMPDDARAILVDLASSNSLDVIIPSVAGMILGSPHFQVR
ncbi:MAG TPA: DUF1800 family protein [Anaerolineales bacterium]|nr:DUF1800 family protein [Anaerolineales bacterium]